MHEVLGWYGVSEIGAVTRGAAVSGSRPSPAAACAAVKGPGFAQLQMPWWRVR